MAKYKPGDKVRIVKEPKRFEDDPGWVQEMDNWKGKIVTIKEDRTAPGKNIRYIVEENRWTWDERWFEPVEEEKKVKGEKKDEIRKQPKTLKAIDEMLKLIKDIKETKDIQKLGKTFYHLFREAEGSPRYPEISYSLDGYPRLKDDDTWRIIVKLWRGEYKDKEEIKKDLKNLKAKIEKQEHKEKPKEKKQDNQLPRNIIVHCPTKEDWIKVVKQALENGCVWRGGDKEICEHYWDNYKEGSCILIEHKTITYGSKSDYSKTHPYSKYPIITAQEYLEKTKQK